MNYLRVSTALRKNKLYIFSLVDLKNLFPLENEKTIKNNMVRWLSRGYFVRLKRDVYEFLDPGSAGRIPDLYIANRLYEPSYISLETALSIYSIIPDIAAGVTSITTKTTRTIKNKYGSFFFKTCKRAAFIGYKIMLYDGFKVCIADREKALVDFMYYRLRSGFPIDFEEERFNKTILNKFNWKKSISYAEHLNNKTVSIIKKCREYTKC